MMNEEKEFKIPEKYVGKMFLSPKDIKDLFGIGDSLLYDYLKTAPFRTEKVGAKIIIFANSFWQWYNGESNKTA